MHLSNFSLENCSCVNGNGGGVEITVTNESDLFFGLPPVNSVIKKCIAQYGNGGGIYLHLADGAQSFVLRDVSFSECDAREGKEIFINAHDLSSVINRESISFGVELNDFTKLNGFERSTLNETFAIPLVVYLWNNFSAPAFVGGSLGHDFSMCGYESSPCSTILKAVSLHFEGKNKDVSICEPFSFDEELDLTSNEWSIASKENEMKCEVSDQKEGAQNGLVESSVSVFVTGIIFSLKKSLTDHESVFECHSEKLTLTKCGMEGGDEAISTVFVKAAGGVVEINEFATKNMKIGDSSVFVVEGNAESVPSMNMTKSNFAEITFGDGSVVECHNGNIDEMSGCTFSSITRSKESGGCISVVNNENDDDGREHKVEIDDCTFEGGCEFYCCTAPHEEEGVGYGGGIMLKMQKQEEEEGKAGFVISSPVFSTDKPNNAKFGKDLFISSPLLIKSIKNETLPFVKDRLELLTEDSMRGYDGEIGKEGKNVAVCGLEEYPCRSVDYGLKRTVSSGVERMIIHGVCDARSVIEMSGMKVEGTNGETDKIQFVKAIEGDGDAIVECKGAVQFKEMGMVIPTAFDNGASILIQTGSDAIKTSIVSCSISTHGSAEGEVSFVLIGASKGIVEIEKTNIAGLSSMCEIMSVSTDCAIAMNNVTFEDIALSGKSAVAMSENTIASSEKNDAEEVWNILFEQCIFANVKHSATINPSLLCCDVSNDVRLKMENSTIDGCGSASSNEGGGMFFLLNEREAGDEPHECGKMFLLEHWEGRRDVFEIAECLTGSIAICAVEYHIARECCFEREGCELAIWGCTADNYGDEEDLLRRVFVFRSEFIFVSSVVGNSSDSKQCGEMKSTCSSLDVGVSHIIPSDYSQLLIWNETTLTGSCSAQRVTIKSMEASRNAEIKVSEISLADEGVVRTSESVRLEKVSFVFGGMQNVVCSCLIHQLNGSLILESVSFHSESRTTANPQLLFDASLIVVEDGVFEADACSVNSLGFTKPVFNILGSERASFDDLGVDDVRCKSSVIECGKSEKVSVSRLTGTNITLQNESLISFENGHSSLFVSLVLSSFSNISRSASGSCIVCTTHPMGCFEMCNCSLSKCSSESQKGSQVAITSAEKILMESCVFEGSLEERTENYLNREEEICRWNGSVVDVAKSSAMLKDTTILNSPEGGITTSGGNVKIEKGEFLNNNPSIEGYPSLRRNIICSDSGILNVMKIHHSSFLCWRAWKQKEANRMKLTFKGMLLVPCNLSFSVAKRKGDEKEIEKYDFDMEGFLSEREAEGSVAKDLLSSCGDEIEVSASILFGNAESPSSTNPFILKNASEAKGGDERIVEGENKEMSIWPIIVIVLVVILLIVLVGFILFVVRWKKQKRRTEELEVIVEDNIRKDPKAIEMVTMEMSPEDQWRRAEREAEKKNEERIKKMVFEKSLGHSESSEHLLSENKIPEWMLEKVEEEEIRKRTPSPSVSSTSTTDSDSTFVRGEDLCPTTSSMSNLVDAMACSSPHEKLIVDLRDSLFMLLHGRNKTKEMAIGTLKEREQTAAQILFWVANLALHSFDEMENELSSLANLSPHLVLFSEHMVICIVMHSDLLSDDDSDSSSISSSTVATSVSDDDRDSLPSSAFEDEDDFRKECLRWKAPELLINKKMGATKESVAFSIGMMLWECLTLQIPFGEYEAEIAGEKSKMERGRPCSPSARLPSLSSSMPACRTSRLALPSSPSPMQSTTPAAPTDSSNSLAQPRAAPSRPLSSRRTVFSSFLPDILLIGVQDSLQQGGLVLSNSVQQMVN
ncbi:uncharacterized protein MONOS_18495 [Monocercomonoides exilis]|uniref:uncharacterized protein n=1 Tax=Monocercomonoides exilis TaxID=2049356 RepID=UPI0035593B69|nr:hypothetical protein MONOS_18495 [Monocercomonoides exilis]